LLWPFFFFLALYFSSSLLSFVNAIFYDRKKNIYGMKFEPIGNSLTGIY